ncbi:MAG TPA: DUF2971 domain-containing protein [Acidobacteriaceae bacterium]|jgi:hypothetical protein|nr:DUF2971 domain-containing protein [Acidobacteriaceae bacterium]
MADDNKASEKASADKADLPWESYSPFERELFFRSMLTRINNKIETPPSAIFHYTSPEVFAKIVRTCKFRLSNAGYLNDQGELTYPVQVARFALRKVYHELKDDSLGDFFEETARTLDSHALFKSWFVASFSLRGDLLSQWRAYCPRGGYSIGLRGERVVDLLKTGGYEFNAVVYDLNEQVKIVRGQIERHVALWRDLRSKYGDVGVDEYDRAVARNLSVRLSEEFVFFKSEAFAEENEWRLVKYLFPVDSVGFFERQGILTPYVEISLAEPDGRLPLEHVYVSPLADPELAEHSARLVLEFNKHTDAWKVVSSPSYRLRF